MAKPTATLVLTPSIGGDFFGEIIAGVAREVVAAGSQLVVVETRQEYTPRDEAGEQHDFSLPVAWSLIDGAVAITTATDEEYLQRLRDEGKAVVLLSSTQMDAFRAPIARPDNRQGTIYAVDHLVAHGHERIGFVGNLHQRDIRDRHDAYRHALEAHGLTADPAHLFETPENAEPGGAVAARALLKLDDRPTALMVATDRNAIGLMSELKAAGVRLPDELAIASFDNIAAGSFSSPSLTTVDPRFSKVGALAARLMLAAARGETTPQTTVTPGSAALITRRSCGCDPDAPGAALPTTNGTRRLPKEAVRGGLQQLLQRELHADGTGVEAGLREAIEKVAADTMRLLEKGDNATSDEIREFTAGLHSLTSSPGTLRRFNDAMTDLAQQAALPSANGNGDGPAVSPRVSAALWKAQAAALLRQAESTDAAVAEQYEVDAGLLMTEDADPRDLQWLAGTSVSAGVLGLWEGEPDSGMVTIAGEYQQSGAVQGLAGQTMSTEEFPPAAFVEATDGAGGEACFVVRVRKREQDWGLLAVSADLDPATERETVQHWAALLVAALESKQRQEEVRRNALYDGLTGLPNRTLFAEQLETSLARWRRSGTPFSVLFLDLDGFKLINDSLGHQMGDRVLKAIADEISGQLRSVDTAARFGGDEFVILLADTEAGRATVAAKRIQAALNKVRTFDGHEIVTRASIGIASSAVEYRTADEVLRDADAAMYRAKTSEPGTIAFFDAPMHESAVRRAELAKDVLFALQNNQFEVHYQPIVNLASGQTDRFEALVRWRHPSRGLVEPSEFLTDIEETSLIVQLGHHVLDEVCQQMRAWGPRVANVSINVSDKEFWSQDLQGRILDTLKKYELSPELLTLEITESVLMRRPEMALRIMHKLHDAGLRLHIDDFGTGYSSLETLHRFPVEAFKIDRSFIQTLSRTDDSAELISSLVKLGKALGLAVVAEGVETEDQLKYLQELGCATGQGYLFMPAVTADKASELLGKSLHDEVEGDA